MNKMKFITKNSAHSTLQLGYKKKYIEQTVNTKFLGLQIDNHINWKNHTEEMIPKLSAACYAVMSMVHISNIISKFKVALRKYLHTKSFYSADEFFVVKIIHNTFVHCL
jgi:hypothetical protein